VRRAVSCIGLSLLLVLPVAARAGGNRSFLVPAFAPCAGPAVCFPPERESRFTFETGVLGSSRSRFIRGGGVALVVRVKGVRDESGRLVTTDPDAPGDDFRVVVPETVTTVPGVGTLPAGFVGDTVIRFDLRSGRGTARLATPAEVPAGLVAASLGSPVVLDSDGRPLARVGSQSRP
jgi:hypothetical protein